MSEIRECRLPSTWTSATLEDFCQIIQGQSPPGNTYNTTGNGLPFFQGKAEFGEVYPTAVKWCTSPKKVAEANDVLISIRAPVGPTNLCPGVACIGRGLAAIRPEGGISSLFVFYGLRYTAKSLAEKSTGSTFEAISGKDLRSHTLPLPPHPEQHRIVAEIEKQFTRLDAAVEALKRVKTNLKRYRASVLKAACEGRLVPTEAALARDEGRDYEPADRLLARILQERRAKWEADQLAKMHAAGKPPNDNKWKAKYREPAPPDTTNLPPLPEGWGWAALGQLSWDASYGTSEKCDYDRTGPPVLRIPNIERGQVDLTDLKFAAELAKRNVEEALAPGDLLIIRTNGSKDLIGRSAIVEKAFERPHFYASYLIRFRVAQVEPIGQWIGAIWDVPQVRSRIENLAATSAGQYNISLRKLGPLPLPLPPATEQERIIGEVERRLSVVDELEMQVEVNVKRAERLRQAILKRAFEGKLVPQDPTDEPTSVLLERIRSERHEREAGQRTIRAGKPRGKRKSSAEQPKLVYG